MTPTVAAGALFLLLLNGQRGLINRTLLLIGVHGPNWTADSAWIQVPLWAQNLFGSAFYIFLLRQFFLAIPREFFEAARMDGCSYLGMFWRIALPLARPALIVMFVFEIQASWTDLLRPLIYLQDPSLYTLPRGLKAVIDTFGNGGEQHGEIIMAASVVATVPLIVLFAFAQRHIMDGIATQARR